MNSLRLPDASKSFTRARPFLGFQSHPLLYSFSNSIVCFSDRNISSSVISCSYNGGNINPRAKKNQKRNNTSNNGDRIINKEKENVWSVDNELAKGEEKQNPSRSRKRGGKRVKNVGGGKKDKNSRVMVSGTMLDEVETVLQTQEPVIRPIWNTFSSSVSGIWKGVGAVFSPITAEMEPIDVGKKNEYLYDCYTLSHIELVQSPSKGQSSHIRRKINWVTLNPYGEIQQASRDLSLPLKETMDASSKHRDLPTFESFDLGSSDLMEDDIMGIEPGLVFFEDGSYSRGPMEIPVGEPEDDSKYFLSPTFKFEQCLVKGCHKRLRIVHTIEFGNGGSDIQIMRVAAYEEKWVSPANLSELSDMEFDLEPFSQRKRIQPSELTGYWKVFEVSASPIYGEETKEGNETPYAYLCTETLKKKNLPENPVHFGEEEMLDMQDVSVLWLPGGITGYVDIKKDGILCIGFSWYSDEGVNLVMERDYGSDGKLKDVRLNTEVKRRWSDPTMIE
ncbi:hypothetical protein MKW92_039641 [Papaver armeniacum]|nr:hypothetical protein MKW92_039641 [Papaver armeniacum]